MKKITLLLFTFFALTITWQGMAQTQVGTGTSTTSYFPIYSCYGYTYSQQVYYATEINTSGDITSLSFYLDPATSTSGSSSTDWTIYLGHSTRTEFADTSDWEDVANLTQVYTGTVTFPAVDNWFTVTLDTPFTYNGTDNLVLAVDENQSGYNCSMYWQKTDDTVNRGIVYRNDSTNPDPETPPTASGVYTYYSNVIFGGIAQACPFPSGMTATNVTSSSADLSWTAGGSETAWNLEWKAGADFTPGTGAEDASDTASGTATYNATGLASGTTYYIYYQADCGGDTSAWSGPFVGTTLCSSYTAPYSQNFDAESTPDIQTCWNAIVSGSTSTYASIESSTSYSVSPSNSIDFYNSSDTTGEYFLVSPNFSDLDNTKRIRFSAYQNIGGTDEGDVLEIGTMTDPTDPATYTSYQTIPYADLSEDAWVNLTVNFDTYAGTDSYIAIKMTFGGTYNDYYFDDFYYEDIPSCTEPSALDATIVSFTSADLSWTPGGGESAWNVEIVEAGTSPTGTPTASGVSNPYSATGLTAETNYEFYVQADCGGGDLSPWAGPFTFFTGYCVSEPSSNDNSGITNVQLVATDFAGSDVTYLNFTGSPVDIQQTVTENLQITFATGYNYDTNVWIDFNDDLVFEASEQVFDGVSASSNPTTLDASFLVPATAPLGNHRMRIGTADSGQATPDPCYNGAYGVTVDLDVNVTAAPACPDPSALTATNISSTGADLGWTEMGTATAWNVEIVDITGGGSVTGTATDTGVSNPFSVSGLTPNNDYEFYVQADCGSAWVGPFAFSTPCDAIASFPYTDGFENAGAISDCWSQEYVSATVDWTFTDANGNSSVSPQTDSYMALFKSNNYSSDATKLVMPTFDLTGLTDPALKFSYTQVDWGGDQDELRVYYKTSAAGSWTLLSEYTSSVSSWTDVVLQLPNASSEYYIAFEGTSGYGYGVTLDDVVVNNYNILLGVDEFSYSSFKYYPNPVNNNLNLSSQKEINNVSVYNMVGQEVYRSTPNTMTDVVDMSGLQAGAYFVKVTVGNATKTVKVIKK